jgi:hypothetical protein
MIFEHLKIQVGIRTTLFLEKQLLKSGKRLQGKTDMGCPKKSDQN